MNRIRQGWALTRISWSVLRSDRSLAAFPVLAAVAALLAAAAFGIPSVLFFDGDMGVPGVIFAAIAIYLVTFAAVFFNVALAAAAAQVLDGHDATVASGVAVARTRLPAISGWAAMVASVNVVIRALQERTGPLGDLLLGGIAIAWNLVTFLAIPVIALEGLGPIDTLKRSAGIFRERWGEQVTGQVSIGAVIALASIIPAALLVAIGVLIGGTVAIGIFVGLAVIIVVIAGILSTALTQIFAVALYRYATGQGATGAFTEATLANSVVPRKAQPGRI
ncbi:MAG TPA: DUF6159 family protein [Miltoncostaeaceae bacterium]|nr:DUF6159 family protein [Miltoncostaeaceae bacterium]